MNVSIMGSRMICIAESLLLVWTYIFCVIFFENIVFTVWYIWILTSPIRLIWKSLVLVDTCSYKSTCTCWYLLVIVFTIPRVHLFLTISPSNHFAVFRLVQCNLFWFVVALEQYFVGSTVIFWDRGHEINIDGELDLTFHVIFKIWSTCY